MIVGTITAYKHRGWVRVVMTANTGKVLGMDLDVTDAMIFLWQLEAALVGSSRRLIMTISMRGHFKRSS
jgi:hypothetical protein